MRSSVFLNENIHVSKHMLKRIQFWQFSRNAMVSRRNQIDLKIAVDVVCDNTNQRWIWSKTKTRTMQDGSLLAPNTILPEWRWYEESNGKSQFWIERIDWGKLKESNAFTTSLFRLRMVDIVSSEFNQTVTCLRKSEDFFQNGYDSCFPYTISLFCC